MRLRFSSMLIAAAATLSVALASPYAHAVGEEEASPKLKGTIGGALLGAEGIMLIEAGFKVRPAWAYIVGGLAGAAGGGVAGHLAEDGDSARLPMFLLAGGLVLTVPTAVAVLATTAYKPPADYTQDRPPSDEPVAEPPQPGATPAPAAAPTSRKSPVKNRRVRTHAAPARLSLYRAPVIPPSIVGLNDRGLLSLGVPAVELREVYSKRELLQTGMKQVTEVRIPVINIAF